MLQKGKIEEIYLRLQKVCGLEEGDKVTVDTGLKINLLGWDNSFNVNMSECVGKSYKVSKVNNYGFRLAASGYCWPFYSFSQNVDREAIVNELKKIYKEHGVEYD